MAEPENRQSNWGHAHPDFDGHLERPVSQMSDGERLRLAWEGTLLLNWARRATIERQDQDREHFDSQRSNA